MSLDLLNSAMFAVVAVEVVGLEVEEVDFEFELVVVLGKMSLDDSAAVEHPQHYCSEEE